MKWNINHLGYKIIMKWPTTDHKKPLTTQCATDSQCCLSESSSVFLNNLPFRRWITCVRIHCRWSDDFWCPLDGYLISEEIVFAKAFPIKIFNYVEYILIQYYYDQWRTYTHGLVSQKCKGEAYILFKIYEAFIVLPLNHQLNYALLQKHITST